jgi:hypothetical protein
MKKRSQFPKGWDEARVKRVLKHYAAQTDEEAVAEDESSFEAPTHTAIEVPVALVPEVRRLIAKHRPPSKRIQPTRRRTARG